ncbi:MAG: hypothetical protein LBB26_02360 [Puniceicoccales bacterium]|jgi:hypothetical protein|nr:hypothetical protein [Puniceicoccales bacterium]
MTNSNAIKKCIARVWHWMFLGSHKNPEKSTGSNTGINRPFTANSPAQTPQTIVPPSPSSQPTTLALAQRVQTITGAHSAEHLRRLCAETFWQGRRNNCWAIALLTSLQKTHPEDYFKLLWQLCNRGELYFRTDGMEKRIPVNLTGDFSRTISDRKPHELLAATLMAGLQPKLTAMVRDDLVEFARSNGIDLPQNFREIFHPAFRWRQNVGVFLIEREMVDRQLRALQLSQKQIDALYGFLEKKYTEIHGGCPTPTLQRVRAGERLLADEPFPVADTDYLVFHGASIPGSYETFFGEQASQPFKVIDGKELSTHAQKKDYDYAPRELLRALLQMKQERGLPGGAIIPVECVQYHAFTLQIPTFDTMEAIENHLSRGGHIIVGSTNWGPHMYMVIACDEHGKMIMYYGDQNGVLSRNRAMGRCLFYSSNGRDVRLYDPMKFKFDVVNS